MARDTRSTSGPLPLDGLADDVVDHVAGVARLAGGDAGIDDLAVLDAHEGLDVAVAGSAPAGEVAVEPASGRESAASRVFGGSSIFRRGLRFDDSRCNDRVRGGLRPLSHRAAMARPRPSPLVSALLGFDCPGFKWPGFSALDCSGRRGGHHLLDGGGNGRGDGCHRNLRRPCRSPHLPFCAEAPVRIARAPGAGGIDGQDGRTAGSHQFVRDPSFAAPFEHGCKSSRLALVAYLLNLLHPLPGSNSPGTL